MSRSFEMQHRCYFSSPTAHPPAASVSRGAGSTRARRARAVPPMNPPGARDRTPPVVRGRPIRRARGGATCHDYYPTHPGRSFSRPLFFHRRGARETARRALDRRSAARASPTGPARQPRDPAPAPLIDTPSLTDPTPSAPPPRRAANSDRAVVQGTSVESRHRNASWRVTACLSRESLRENKPRKKRFARRVGGHFSSSDERTRRTRALLFRGGVVSVRGSWTV